MRNNFLALLLFLGTVAIAQTNIGVTTTGSAGPCGAGNGTDSGNANLLCGVQVSVPALCAAQSVSFFVTAPNGNLVLSIYDATGSAGAPGKLLAQTAPFTAGANWNTHALLNQVTLKPGIYWLCYLPSSNTLWFAVQATASGLGFFGSTPYSAIMPALAPPGQLTGGHCVWSIYASVRPVKTLSQGYYVVPNGSTVDVP